MKETVLEFGPDRRLVGVLTRPAPGTPPAEMALVLTNAGIIHRVGPDRLHVRLARHMARAGFPVFRYDLPGVGDSESIGGRDLEEERLTGARAALDALQRAGVARRFVVMGICSGADQSFRVAASDPRVAGAVLVDPTAVFSSPRHRLHTAIRRSRRLLRPRVWWKLLTGGYLRRGGSRGGGAPVPIPGAARSLDPRAHPDEWGAVRGALESMAARQVRLLVVVTSHDMEVFTYPGQLLDAFPDVEGLEAVLEVDRVTWLVHTFPSEPERRYLEDAVLRRLRDWVEVPAEQGAAPAPIG